MYQVVNVRMARSSAWTQHAAVVQMQILDAVCKGDSMGTHVQCHVLVAWCSQAPMLHDSCTWGLKVWCRYCLSVRQLANMIPA